MRATQMTPARLVQKNCRLRLNFGVDDGFNWVAWAMTVKI